MWLWEGATPREAAWLGFWFNVGTFAAGTYWLYIGDPHHGRARPSGSRSLSDGRAGRASWRCITRLLGYAVARWLPAARRAALARRQCPPHGCSSSGGAAGSSPASPGCRSATRRRTPGSRGSRRSSACTASVRCCWCARARWSRSFSAPRATRVIAAAVLRRCRGSRRAAAAVSSGRSRPASRCASPSCRARFRRIRNGSRGQSRDHSAHLSRARPRAPSARRSSCGPKPRCRRSRERSRRLPARRSIAMRARNGSALVLGIVAPRDDCRERTTTPCSRSTTKV